jgi:acyl-coenzyme A synthetase/AMP-(fatty) acid ligase
VCHVKGRNNLRVYENRVVTISATFGPKRDEVTANWSMLHVEELRNLYSSPNIIRMITSMGMRWTEHVAHVRAMINVYKMFLEVREHSEDLGTGGG